MIPYRAVWQNEFEYLANSVAQGVSKVILHRPQQKSVDLVFGLA